MASKDKNTLVTVNENTALSGMVANLTSTLSSLGYEHQTTERNEKGETAVVVLDNETGGNMEIMEKLSETEFNALKTLRDLSAFQTMERVVVAWKCYELKDYAKNNNFKSVGALVETNVKGLSAVTVNQYCRVAELFLTLPNGCDVPVWKYDWCKGVSITNLVQSLALVKKSGSPEQFYTDYIESGKLHLRASLSTLKGDIQNVEGKSKSKSKSKSENENESESKIERPVMSYGTMFALLSEKLLSFESLPDNVMDSLSTIGEYMETVGLISASKSESESESESESK